MSCSQQNEDVQDPAKALQGCKYWTESQFRLPEDDAKSQ